MEWLSELANERPALLARYICYALVGVIAVVAVCISGCKAKAPSNKKISSGYKALAELLITDKTVLKNVNNCFTDYKKYYNTHQSQYEDRGIENAVEQGTIMWFAIVDCLLENNLAVEVDWKEEPSVVAELLNNTIKNELLKIDTEWFSSEDLTECFEVINSKWKEQNTVLAAIDIDSDSYVLVALKTEQFEKAKKLATDIERNIDYANNL